MTLTRDERDELVAAAIEVEDKRFPAPGAPPPSEREGYVLAEQFYVAVGRYFDELPRVVVSACPHCGEPLRRAFDPWGLDGPWWGEHDLCEYGEPSACEHFRVLLGALRVGQGDVPARTLMQSYPGPEVPFVVPRLLELPTMIAVVGELTMERGGPAYPIAYFSEQPIEGAELHQPWRRTMFWYQRDGHDAWSARNDVWDFELGPWVDRDLLRWVILRDDDPVPRVHKASDGASCPLVGLPGERAPQVVLDGDRDFLPVPDGSLLNPFEEDGGA